MAEKQDRKSIRFHLSPPKGLIRVIPLLLILLLSSCGSRGDAVKIGVIAGLSGGNADLGESGRNGILLAVTRYNSKGGLNGTPVELLIRDDENEVASAEIATKDLISKDVSVIIGPFTTTLTERVVQIASASGLLVITPTASAYHLHGKDDNLITINSSTRDNAYDYAEQMFTHRDYRTATMLIDQQNSSFSESWASQFQTRYEELGGTVVNRVKYNLARGDRVGEIVSKSLEDDPQSLIMISNSVDVARIAPQIRKISETIPILAAEWAGTQQLIEMGGPAVTGIEILQNYDQFGNQPDYLNFVREYREMFNQLPGFSSVLAYDAAMVILQALEGRERKEPIKDFILGNSPFQGLQQPIQFNEFGDSRRTANFVVIEGRQFRKAP